MLFLADLTTSWLFTLLHNIACNRHRFYPTWITTALRVHHYKSLILTSFYSVELFTISDGWTCSFWFVFCFFFYFYLFSNGAEPANDCAPGKCYTKCENSSGSLKLKNFEHDFSIAIIAHFTIFNESYYYQNISFFVLLFWPKKKKCVGNSIWLNHCRRE